MHFASSESLYRLYTFSFLLFTYTDLLSVYLGKYRKLMKKMLSFCFAFIFNFIVTILQLCYFSFDFCDVILDAFLSTSLSFSFNFNIILELLCIFIFK